MRPKASVLVVDDEAAIRRALRISLTSEGFSVEEARSGEDALKTVLQQPFDLLLLDINMPGISGIDACRRIRSAHPQTGIVMVSVRNLAADKIRALEAGADDYVTKPFDVGELTARLRAVLRRTRGDGAQVYEQAVLQAGNVKLDLEHRALWKGGRELHLTPIEFDLLAFLMKNRGTTVPHLKLLRTIWGVEYAGELEYLRTYVRMLRKKIEDDPAKPEYILTEPWVGYRFRDPSEPNLTVAAGS